MANTYTSLHYHFTFSTKNREPWIQYVRNQRAHHPKRTFQQEYLELLEKHGVDYDERYLWG